MADVVLNTKINNTEIEKTVNNFSRLKNELKQAKSELLQFEVGTAGFAKAQANVSKLTDKMKDLNDSTRIQGTGVERLTQSFNLLTDSFSTGDIDKAKLAFTGLGQAMKAIPIFLLIEGARLLFENWDKVSAVFSESAKQILANERALTELTLAVSKNKAESDALIISKEFELDQLKKQGGSLDEIIHKYNEIDNLRFSNIIGEINKVDKEIENLIFKQKDLNDNLQLTDFLPDFLGGDKTQKDIRSIGDEIEKLKVKRKELENETLKVGLENKAKIQVAEEDEQKRREDASLKRQKLEEEEIKRKRDAQARDAAVTNELIDREERDYKDALKRQNEAAELARQENLNSKIKAAEVEEKYFRDLENKALKDSLKEYKDNEKKKEELDKALKAAKLTRENNYFNAAQSLAQTFFAFQLNRAKGNAAEELKLKKQAFEVEKAFNVARAIQDGVRAVQGALAQSSVIGPAAVPLAVSYGVLAAANVAKILATQFDGGSQTIDTQSNVNVPSQSGQTPNTFQPPTFVQQSTQLDANGNPINGPIQAVVVETQMTSTQNRVSRLYNQSRI